MKQTFFFNIHVSDTSYNLKVVNLFVDRKHLSVIIVKTQNEEILRVNTRELITEENINEFFHQRILKLIDKF